MALTPEQINEKAQLLIQSLFASAKKKQERVTGALAGNEIEEEQQRSEEEVRELNAQLNGLTEVEKEEVKGVLQDFLATRYSVIDVYSAAYLNSPLDARDDDLSTEEEFESEPGDEDVVLRLQEIALSHNLNSCRNLNILCKEQAAMIFGEDFGDGVVQKVEQLHERYMASTAEEQLSSRENAKEKILSILSGDDIQYLNDQLLEYKDSLPDLAGSFGQGDREGMVYMTSPVYTYESSVQAVFRRGNDHEMNGELSEKEASIIKMVERIFARGEQRLNNAVESEVGREREMLEDAREASRLGITKDVESLYVSVLAQRQCLREFFDTNDAPGEVGVLKLHAEIDKKSQEEFIDAARISDLPNLVEMRVSEIKQIRQSLIDMTARRIVGAQEEYDTLISKGDSEEEKVQERLGQLLETIEQAKEFLVTSGYMVDSRTLDEAVEKMREERAAAETLRAAEQDVAEKKAAEAVTKIASSWRGRQGRGQAAERAAATKMENVTNRVVLTDAVKEGNEGSIISLLEKDTKQEYLTPAVLMYALAAVDSNGQSARLKLAAGASDTHLVRKTDLSDKIRYDILKHYAKAKVEGKEYLEHEDFRKAEEKIDFKSEINKLIQTQQFEKLHELAANSPKELFADIKVEEILQTEPKDKEGKEARSKIVEIVRAKQAGVYNFARAIERYSKGFADLQEVRANVPSDMSALMPEMGKDVKQWQTITQAAYDQASQIKNADKRAEIKGVIAKKVTEKTQDSVPQSKVKLESRFGFKREGSVITASIEQAQKAAKKKDAQEQQSTQNILIAQLSQGAKPTANEWSQIKGLLYSSQVRADALKTEKDKLGVTEANRLDFRFAVRMGFVGVAEMLVEKTKGNVLTETVSYDKQGKTGLQYLLAESRRYDHQDHPELQQMITSALVKTPKALEVVDAEGRNAVSYLLSSKLANKDKGQTLRISLEALAQASGGEEANKVAAERLLSVGQKQKDKNGRTAIEHMVHSTDSSEEFIQQVKTINEFAGTKVVQDVLVEKKVKNSQGKEEAKKLDIFTLAVSEGKLGLLNSLLADSDIATAAHKDRQIDRLSMAEAVVTFSAGRSDKDIADLVKALAKNDVSLDLVSRENIFALAVGQQQENPDLIEGIVQGLKDADRSDEQIVEMLSAKPDNGKSALEIMVERNQMTSLSRAIGVVDAIKDATLTMQVGKQEQQVSLTACAVIKSNQDALGLLSEKGANMDKKEDGLGGNTPLTWSLRQAASHSFGEARSYMQSASSLLQYGGISLDLTEEIGTSNPKTVEALVADLGGRLRMSNHDLVKELKGYVDIRKSSASPQQKSTQIDGLRSTSEQRRISEVFAKGDMDQIASLLTHANAQDIEAVSMPRYPVSGGITGSKETETLLDKAIRLKRYDIVKAVVQKEGGTIELTSKNREVLQQRLIDSVGSNTRSRSDIRAEVEDILEIDRSLLKKERKGADDLTTPRGRPLLVAAAEARDNELASLLLKNGANVEQVYSKDITIVGKGKRTDEPQTIKTSGLLSRLNEENQKEITRLSVAAGSIGSADVQKHSADKTNAITSLDDVVPENVDQSIGLVKASPQNFRNVTIRGTLSKDKSLPEHYFEQGKYMQAYVALHAYEDSERAGVISKLGSLDDALMKVSDARQMDYLLRISEMPGNTVKIGNPVKGDKLEQEYLKPKAKRDNQAMATLLSSGAFPTEKMLKKAVERGDYQLVAAALQRQESFTIGDKPVAGYKWPTKSDAQRNNLLDWNIVEAAQEKFLQDVRKRPEEAVKMLAAIPADRRNDFIAQSHSKIGTAHFGSDKVLHNKTLTEFPKDGNIISYAIRKGHVDLVSAIIEDQNIDVRADQVAAIVSFHNAQNPPKDLPETYLERAMQEVTVKSDLELVTLLALNGAKVGQQQVDLAISQGKTDFVIDVLKAGDEYSYAADLQTDENMENYLTQVVQQGCQKSDWQLVQNLVQEAFATVTPEVVKLAVANGDLEFAQKVFASLANPKAKESLLIDDDLGELDVYNLLRDQLIELASNAELDLENIQAKVTDILNTIPDHMVQDVLEFKVESTGLSILETVQESVSNGKSNTQGVISALMTDERIKVTEDHFYSIADESFAESTKKEIADAKLRTEERQQLEEEEAREELFEGQYEGVVGSAQKAARSFFSALTFGMVDSPEEHLKRQAEQGEVEHSEGSPTEVGSAHKKAAKLMAGAIGASVSSSTDVEEESPEVDGPDIDGSVDGAHAQKVSARRAAQTTTQTPSV